MDLNISCKEISIEPSSYNEVVAFLKIVNKSDLDNEDVAECISIDTIIKAKGVELDCSEIAEKVSVDTFIDEHDSYEIIKALDIDDIIDAIGEDVLRQKLNPDYEG